MQLTNEKKIVSREQEIIFHNWTDRDFVGIWVYGPEQSDPSKKGGKVTKKVYNLKAGKSYYLPFYLAEKFAREIADREYWGTFNKKLEEVKVQSGGQADRLTLEHRVQNSPEVSKLSRQDLMDKCVELIDPVDELETVRPEEVRVREVLLKRDERAKELREKYPGIETPRVNEKAIKESEEFEPEN